jgi:4-hydroxybenzoate polyprenyltransferase
MRIADALLLGRVSNLPTVWTNVLAGAALGGAAIDGSTLSLAIASLSLFYTGGMYLNDAFDRDFDRAMRPERPIPSGRAAASTVFVAGFTMLLAGVFLLGIAGGARAALAGLALAGVIVW